jgi:hypothetical protein
MTRRREIGQAMMQWPLRFGTMPGDEKAARAVAVARALWPSSKLSSAYELTRDQARCDVLVYVGDVRGLGEALAQSQIKRKARVVLVADWGAPNHHPDALLPEAMHAMQRCSASGVILLRNSIGTDQLGRMLNELVNQLSHNVPLRFAIKDAFDSPMDIWADTSLAEFRLSDVATQLNQRAHSMPADVEVSLSSRAVELLRNPTNLVLASDLGQVAMGNVKIDMNRLDFSGEGRSATDIAEINRAIETAPVPRSIAIISAARFLQQQSKLRIDGRLISANDGFVLGVQSVVLVRIGPKSSKWQGLRQAFPDPGPRDSESWTLRIWLTEPSQLAEPRYQDVELRATGPSQTAEFSFLPKHPGRFDGRLTVTHRGRVLQTARLVAGVREHQHAPIPDDAAPQIDEWVPVRARIGDLGDRRQFDLAFVTNHAASGAPRAVALAEKHAWISDIHGALQVTATLNNSLTRVANEVADYAGGIDGEPGRELLIELARQGANLQRMLVHEQLRNQHNRPEIAEHEYIQIISTRNDHEPVPFEFIYDYAVPRKTARPCAHWRDALTTGACPSACHGGGKQVVCPMGFWGLRKVIERHQLSADLATTGRELLLQSEPGRETAELVLGTEVLVAASRRVLPADLQAVVTSINSHVGKHATQAGDWDAWEGIVESKQPTFILSMPHTDGTAAAISLEIGDVTLEALDISLLHVRPSTSAPPPLVALIGCDTGTAQSYGEHLQVFRQHGAAVVLGTIATVFGGHAARVSRLLAEELLRDSDQPIRLGEALRAIKRRALLENLFMPLCLVAFGDADWQLLTRQSNMC